MAQLYKHVLLILVLMAVLHNTSGVKKGSSSSSKNTSKKTQSSSNNPSQGSKTQPNSPRQPSSPAEGKNPGNPNQPYQYPVRTEADPGRYRVGGRYANWNPNNKILSPRYGGAHKAGGFGKGGSPFSQSVQSMGYGPSAKSKGFGKQAAVAAGAGALAGMALGYGIGRFPQPNFQFRSSLEEYYYNYYMHKHHGINPDTGHTVKLPSQGYEQHMEKCMKRKDLLKEQDMLDTVRHGNIHRDETLIGPDDDVYQDKDRSEQANATTSPAANNDLMPAAIQRDEEDDTVSFLMIGYPALTEQMKARKCIEMFFLEKTTEEFPQSHNNSNGHFVSGLLLLLTTFMHVLHHK